MTTQPSVQGLPGLTGPRTAKERRRELRRLLSTGAFMLPGVTDALGARLAAETGFKAVYATGAGFANAQFGLPDIGLLTQSEVTEHAARLAGATDLPLIVDADTGFGGPLMAVRTARRLEQAGAAALQIEDQEMPKRCGHFDDHSLIPGEHMATKIAAVRDGLEDEDTVLIARTDARSVFGIEEAISRSRLYVEAGADVIFVEAPRTMGELELVGRELADVPLVVNVVEGGKTPELTVADYDALGFGVILYANFVMRSMLHAGRQALQHLSRAGETGTYAHRMLSWQERQELVNLDAFRTAEEALDQPWQQPARASEGYA